MRLNGMELSLSTLAIITAIGFYLIMDKAIEGLQPEPVDVWHCDGWEGKMYPTERSMRRALK